MEIDPKAHRRINDYEFFTGYLKAVLVYCRMMAGPSCEENTYGT